MEQEHTTPKKKRRIRPVFIILPVILLAGGYYGFTRLQHSMHYESTDNAFIESNALLVAARIPGYIDSILVDDYQEVTPGQVLFVLDDRELKISVLQAEADLASAEAELENARATLANNQQNVKVAQSNKDLQQVKTDKAQRDYERDQNLYTERSISARQWDEAGSNYQLANQQLSTTGEQVNLASSQVKTAQAMIKKAEALVLTRKAQLEMAKLKLSYARVSAPLHGKLGKKNIAVGQFIQGGQTLFTLVDDEKFWIVANFKETQLDRMSVGQEVAIHIDGYPGKKITGKITAFSDATGARFSLLPPDNATGNFVKVTQRVPVRIEFDNPEELEEILKAGLSVQVDVKVK